MLYLVKRFDPAELFVIEQSQNHSEELIKEWLVKYKFKAWNKTTTGKKVTTQMKRKRAIGIAKILSNAERWHSHGRGLSRKELEGDEIKLRIDDFGADPDLNSKVRQYYDLFIECCSDKKAGAAIHTRFGIVPIG